MNTTKQLIPQLKRYKWIYVLFMPAFVFALVFCYMPIYGIQIAFRDYRFLDGFLGSKFVGLKYFLRMFNEPTFLIVMRNTVIISFLKIVLVFPCGIIFAVFLNEITSPTAKRIYQTISYMPHFLSWIVLAGIIRTITDLDGPINTVVSFFGGEPTLFLTRPIPFIGTLIFSDLWHAVGWNSIIYLAAISGISKDLYESADLDGAGRLRKMLAITFPSILPVVFIMFILRLGQVMNAGFDQILNLYNPLVYSIGDIIDTYVYRVGLMQMNFSYSTAIGLFKNVIGLTLVLITNALSRRMEGAL